ALRLRGKQTANLRDQPRPCGDKALVWSSTFLAPFFLNPALDRVPHKPAIPHEYWPSPRECYFVLVARSESAEPQKSPVNWLVTMPATRRRFEISGQLASVGSRPLARRRNVWSSVPDSPVAVLHQGVVQLLTNRQYSCDNESLSLTRRIHDCPRHRFYSNNRRA